MHGEEIRELFRRMGIEPETIMIGQVKYAGLRFIWDDRVIALIKQCGGRWSKENRCWYVERKKRVLQKLVCRIAELKGIETIRPEIQQVLKKIRLKGYSEETLRNYVNYLGQWLDHIYPKKPGEISKEEVEDYLYRLLWVDKLSESTINGIISAIKFYYEEVCSMSRIIYDLTRPAKPLQIPKLFSRQEVESILKHTENLKHRTILLVCYSSGLRVSEVVNLKVRDIDSGRMVINIIEAKGKKDRVVPLSPVLLGYLRRYFSVYHPKDYLFEGQGRLQYSTRSVQEILRKSKLKAGVKKQGSVHALRHSYATHLLDKGVDITYIQKLLGHHDLRTTLRYLHVTVRDLHRVQSPLDDLDL